MKKIIFFAILISVSSLQAAFSCEAKVKRVLIYGTGNVNLLHSGRNNWTVVCNLSEERKGVSVTTCAMWVSLLQDFKKRDASATFYYNTTPEYDSCTELPTYSNSPAPVYIGEL